MTKTKKVIFMAVFAGACFFNFSSTAHAEVTWNEKLGRGLLNIVASPIEIARTINVQSNARGPAYGWTMGLVEGIGRTFVRFGAGAIDAVTFPFEFPKDDREALLAPDYPWQKWDVQYL